jgi:hypothetical protein
MRMIRVLYSVYAYKVSLVKICAYDTKNIIRMIRMLELWCYLARDEPSRSQEHIPCPVPLETNQ